MKILYVDDNEYYHRNDLLDQELACLGHEVIRTPNFEPTIARVCDLVWVEMVSQNAIAATACGHRFSAPLVIRLSAMELYKGKIDAVNWKRVDAFLVEGQHLKDYFLEEWWGPLVPPQNIHVFPTGIRMSDFPLRTGKPNHKIAMVSQFHWRKGVQLIPDILEAIPEPYTISVIGKVIDRDALNYVQHEIERRGLTDRFAVEKFTWPRSRLLQWLRGYTYLLHPSYTDGVPRAVNEAMATGLCPMVHRFRGAEDLYPDWCIWDRIDELPAILERKIEPGEYRQYVADHYSLKLAGERADALIEELTRK